MRPTFCGGLTEPPPPARGNSGGFSISLSTKVPILSGFPFAFVCSKWPTSGEFCAGMGWRIIAICNQRTFSALPLVPPRVIIEYQRARRLYLVPFLRAEVYLLQFLERCFPARSRGALPPGARARDPRPGLGVDSGNGLPGRRHAGQSRSRCLGGAARRRPRTPLGGSHHRSRSGQHCAGDRPRVPTGTMGNTIAIKLLTEHGQEVISDSRAHLLDYELAMVA